jgi:hypothetical protein
MISKIRGISLLSMLLVFSGCSNLSRTCEISNGAVNYSDGNRDLFFRTDHESNVKVGIFITGKYDFKVAILMTEVNLVKTENGLMVGDAKGNSYMVIENTKCADALIEEIKKRKMKLFE